MEQKSFENIAQQLRPKLTSKATSMLGDDSDALDVVQDVLLKLWTMRDRLDVYRSVEALAMVITHRLCLDRLKKCRCEPYRGEEPPDAWKSPHDELEQKENGETLDRMLAQLPGRQQAILKMKHIDGLENDEIARIAGMTESSVRVTLMRARNRIKELFLSEHI